MDRSEEAQTVVPVVGGLREEERAFNRPRKAVDVGLSTGAEEVLPPLCRAPLGGWPGLFLNRLPEGDSLGLASCL